MELARPAHAVRAARGRAGDGRVEPADVDGGKMRGWAPAGADYEPLAGGEAGCACEPLADGGAGRAPESVAD